jgi:hypothetical protein
MKLWFRLGAGRSRTLGALAPRSLPATGTPVPGLVSIGR